MKFCSNCGSDQLEFSIPASDHKQRFCCLDCKTIHYSNPTMIVGCLVQYKGGILLAKRGIEPRKGYWNLPCGFMENEETIEQGAVREVLEETGLEVDIQVLHTVFSVPKSNQVYLIFLASTLEGKFELTEESVEIGFFQEKDVPWTEIAFSSNTFALEKYFEKETAKTASVHVGQHLLGL